MMSVHRAVCSFCRVVAVSRRSLATQPAAALSRVISESYQRRERQQQQPLQQENEALWCSQVIENRNPRNLEELGLARKQLGWQLHHPRKDYWHKLNFSRSNRNISANVTHCSGAVVISASTNETAIRHHLESTTDVSAASLIGAVLAERCLAAGITSIHFNKEEYVEPKQSQRLKAFLDEFKENGITLDEVPSRAHEIEDELLGVDYDVKENEELRQNKEFAQRRAVIAEIAATMRQRAITSGGPVNFKVLPDGRGVSADTGEIICPTVKSTDQLTREAEEERRRRSVYVVKPPSNNQKPEPTKMVYAE